MLHFTNAQKGGRKLRRRVRGGRHDTSFKEESECVPQVQAMWHEQGSEQRLFACKRRRLSMEVHLEGSEAK